MPIFKLQAVENKSTDWKVVNLISEEGISTIGVSVNRINKKNETFPAFDDIVVGKEVDGNLWTSPAGKHYLFAPEAKKTYKTFQKNPAVAEKLMDRKESSIERFQVSKEQGIDKSQDRKEHGIMVASTASMASSILVALMSKGDIEEWGDKWLEIRHWLAKEWNNMAEPRNSDGSKMPNFETDRLNPVIQPEEVNEFRDLPW